MPLTDTAIKQAKPKIVNGKAVIRRLSDEKGMYLFVDVNGSRYFRMDYRFAGKRKCISLGVYPETTLKEARDKRDEARKLLQEGVDPSAAKKAKKLNIIEEHANTFKHVAQEWFEKRRSAWSELHATRILCAAKTGR